MIEIDVPKDIREFEAKLIGPFTARQAVCAIFMAAFAIFVFKGLGDVLPGDVKVIVTLIVVVPFLLIGWVKPYGMHFEKFLKTAFVSNVLSPKRRKYKIENTLMLNEQKKQKNSNLSARTKADIAKVKKRKKIDGEIAYL